MLCRLVEVKHALVSMVVSQLWIEWRQANSKQGYMVRTSCLDEDWWSKIDFLLKFTTPTFEFLRNTDIDQPFLGEVYDVMDSMAEKTMDIISQECPQLLFVDDPFVDLVKKIIIDRWSNFNTLLHTSAHALNPKFYDEKLIAQSNGKRKAPHKDREVANGVKKSLMRMFLAHLQREVKEEFVILLQEQMIMQIYQLWRREAPCIQLFISRKELENLRFIHFVKCNRLGSYKAEDLVYVHSNLRLAFPRGPKYNNGPSKEWDVDAKSPSLDLSLAALNIEVQPGSGIGPSSSSAPPSTIEHASASIFYDDYDDED
eukprot:PITA_15266